MPIGTDYDALGFTHDEALQDLKDDLATAQARIAELEKAKNWIGDCSAVLLQRCDELGDDNEALRTQVAKQAVEMALLREQIAAAGVLAAQTKFNAAIDEGRG